jgi:hypothetical protein
MFVKQIGQVPMDSIILPSQYHITKLLGIGLYDIQVKYLFIKDPVGEAFANSS